MLRRRCIAFLAALALLAALAASPAFGQTTLNRLPAPVAKALRDAGVPLEAVGVWVQDVDAAAPALAVNPGKPFNPASVMKLLTTAAGLELLGPAHLWRTEALTDGTLRGGVLEGNVYLRGGGDPGLTLDAIWTWMREWRARGLREIRGDIVIDRSLFDVEETDPGRFDGQPLRAYNVLPDALLLNYKALRLYFVPREDGTVSVAADPRPAPGRLDVQSRLRAVEGRCGYWRSGLRYELQRQGEGYRLVFSGSYPARCGEQVWTLAPLEHQHYAEVLLSGLWSDVGGRLEGGFRDGAVPEGARRFSVHASQPLAEQIRRINKWSNNVMARQLFLSLGAEEGASPAATTDGAAAVRDWLGRSGLEMPGMVLDNGSGLSREARLTAEGLGRLLVMMWRSPAMPEFIASLPVYGVDGTLRRRGQGTPVTGRAHLKGGTLNGVRGLAGYILDAGGRRQVVVWLVNHRNARATRRAQDALVTWVHGR